ncbi:hypothetical protein HYW94_04425 [Candidatus Uhrbacteria bacterium]|nr:hypothetical protein [Candidatus Uhrbacteria bacterium]
MADGRKIQVKDLPLWLGWLRDILTKAAEISDEEVDELDNGPVVLGEEVIGTIPDSLLRLHILSKRISEDAQKMGEEHVAKFHESNKPINSEDCRRLYESIAAIHRQYSDAKNLFWNCVRRGFDIKEVGIGIRENNTIVLLSEESEEDELREQLEARDLPEVLTQLIFGARSLD